jgi:hypothetical protein
MSYYTITTYAYIVISLKTGYLKTKKLLTELLASLKKVAYQNE